MRVLLTTDTIGGVWTYTKELTEGLLDGGHAVALASFGDVPSPDHSAWCAGMHARHHDSFCYASSETPLEWMDNNDSSFSSAEALLLDLANSFRADLLHSNQFCFGKLPFAMPKLVVAHSDVLSWAAACRRSGIDESPWLARYKDLVNTGLMAADAVVAPTHWMLQTLGQHFRLPHDGCVIHNGRDIPAASAETFRKLQAVTVGRLWDPAKGVAILADVESPFPILVAGEVRHKDASASFAGICATLVGPLSEESLLSLFRSSSVYLALSIYEPFGLAPLEAALCGCAILARDIPSLREVWGDAALYFQSASALQQLLNDVYRSAELRNNLQRQAQLRAETMNRKKMTARYLDLYRHLLDPSFPFPLETLPYGVPTHAS